ncbi:MAG: DEAD/DEAH box helicase family protein [Synergistaceae bacterium]|jgi:superfamily II DNA or RNA helicase|nr:DEAD/DEAH box helicase family protein [Synergistaceae bacterium]
MLTLKDITLHAWQTKCLQRWFENGFRGIAGVATGAGKTILGLAAVCRLSARFPDMALKVKIIVPKVFLANQWRDDILRILGIGRGDVGLYHGTFKEKSDKPFMVYVLNTARWCAARHIVRDVRAGNSVFLICDECHHFGSPENARVFDFPPHIPPERYFALGLSATPRGERFEDVLVPSVGKEIYRYALEDASRDQVTSDYAIFNIAVYFSPDEEEEYSVYTEKITKLKRMLKQKHPPLFDANGWMIIQKLRILTKRRDKIGETARLLWILYLRRKETVHAASARLTCGVELTRLLMPDRRIILFTERIETAEELFALLQKNHPGKICKYHSEMPPLAKQYSLESYRQGEKTAIVCCRALDEGLNVPETDAGIIISMSGSPRQRVQRIGRVVRRGDAVRPKQIYYLHIPGTAESSAILPEGTETVTRDLYYDAALNRFEHPGYDELYARALEKLSASGASAPRIENAEKQFIKGSVRTDFLLSEKTCMNRIADAGPDERDYWIAMLLIVRTRENYD